MNTITDEPYSNMELKDDNRFKNKLIHPITIYKDYMRLELEIVILLILFYYLSVIINLIFNNKLITGFIPLILGWYIIYGIGRSLYTFIKEEKENDRTDV